MWMIVELDFTTSRQVSTKSPVGKEASFGDAEERISENVVNAGQTAARAATVGKRPKRAVVDDRTFRRAAIMSLGGTIDPPLGVGGWRPSENRCRNRRCCDKISHFAISSLQFHRLSTRFQTSDYYIP